MELGEPYDEPPELGSPPPPPDDRLWRHPSEVASGSPTRRRRGWPPWMVAGVSALGASLVTTGLVLTLVGVRAGDRAQPLSVERQLVRPRSLPTVASSPVVDIADRARAAIVQLRVRAGERLGNGSGVIFRSDGHVLTSAHVVAGATAIAVSLANGREMEGILVGSDAETDTAVVKLPGGPFPVATLGTAVDLRVGETAVAIGSPLGLSGGPSVTVGVISALHRDVHPGDASDAGATLFDMIQTDAEISPGCSGGALLDSNGAVIGITTSVTSGDDAGGGDGFATAIDVARSVADELISSGKVAHVWLGVEGSDVDAATATELDVDSGAVIGQVKPESPAARAGLAGRDVIVGLNGRPVRTMGELIVGLRALSPGTTVTIQIVRDRQRMAVPVTLTERPASS